MAKYGVNILLYCQLIEAENKADLDNKINAYLDVLAQVPDQSIVWESVQWDVEETYENGEE